MKLYHLLAFALSVAAALSCCFAALGQEKPQGPEPPIRVTVERVNVGVIVTDGSGNFVDGLRREDFQILDNGMEQPITDFLSVMEPARVLLLIESGPAVVFLGKEHIRAAEKLLNGLAADDRVAVAGYSKEPDLLLDFTADKATARYALENLNFMLGFARLNLSSSLASAIDWLGTLGEKTTIVVLSTGIDTTPQGKWQAIEQKLETSDVRVMAVSLSGDFRKPIKHRVLSREEKENRAYVKQGFAAGDRDLSELSRLTGGRVYFPKSQKDFDRAYAEIAQVIRHEYSIAFRPAVQDGQIHSIMVKVQGFDRRIDHRQAYLAPVSAPAPPAPTK
ncbi:MAG TPA: VWA domain-containing protein [Candidatus Acidoferrum sp.]|nr:VWA domain-containing protein [Candidatus Acidoferrum sp.]